MTKRPQIIWTLGLLWISILALIALLFSGYALTRATAAQRLAEGGREHRNIHKKSADEPPTEAGAAPSEFIPSDDIIGRLDAIESRLADLESEMRLAVASNREDLDQRIHDAINMAIPQSRRIEQQRMVEEAFDAIRKGDKGYLGVSAANMEPDVAVALQGPELVGALVLDVEEGSPAEKAGFQKGDIILKVGGRLIPDSPGLERAVAEIKPDTDVEIEYLRYGTPMKAQVVIAGIRQRYSEAARRRIEHFAMRESVEMLRAEVNALRSQVKALSRQKAAHKNQEQGDE